MRQAADNFSSKLAVATEQNLLTRILPLIFITLVLVSSCKKNDIPIDYDRFFDCKNSQVWDSSEIAGQLVGSWKLTAMYCFWTGVKNTDTMDVEVKFESSGNFILKNNGSIRAEGSWSITNPSAGDPTYYELNLSEGDGLLRGVILSCTDQILFYNSNIDGCDKVYNRIQ